MSSTFLDLKEERSAIVSALLQMEAFPAGMELFPAADEDAWTLIERVISDSDYYLLVIGGKYGSIDADTQLSYTEKEYDFAVRSKKPVMAFLHADPEEIPLGKSEKDDASREKLARFRAKVESHKHVKYWSSSDDLAGKVALSFSSFRTTYPAVGWIRGDTQTSTEALAELNELRKQLANANDLLEVTASGPPSGAEGLSGGTDRVGFVAPGETKVRSVPSNQYATTYSGDVAIDVTWDELFGAIGPDLLDEAEQRGLREAVNRWLAARYGPGFRGRIRTSIKKEGESSIRFSGTAIRLSDEDFGTMLIQFRALGLLTRGTRKRSVSDRGTYWALTPYGDNHLTTLRAISRRPPASAGGGGADEEEEEEE